MAGAWVLMEPFGKIEKQSGESLEPQESERISALSWSLLAASLMNIWVPLYFPLWWLYTSPWQMFSARSEVYHGNQGHQRSFPNLPENPEMIFPEIPATDRKAAPAPAILQLNQPLMPKENKRKQQGKKQKKTRHGHLRTPQMLPEFVSKGDALEGKTKKKQLLTVPRRTVSLVWRYF